MFELFSGNQQLKNHEDRSSGFSKAYTQVLSDRQSHSESQAPEQYLPALHRRTHTEPNRPGESAGLGAAGSDAHQGAKGSEGELWPQRGPRLQWTPLGLEPLDKLDVMR